AALAKSKDVWRALRALAQSMDFWRAIRVVAILAALAGWTAPGDALAANFTVTQTADAGDVTPGDGACDASPISGVQCTLRAAIQEANALGGGPHTIPLPANHYTLTRTGTDDTALNGDLDITANVVIQGAGAATTIVQACDADALPTCTGIDRVFQVLSSG